VTVEVAALVLIAGTYGAVSGFNDGGSLLASFTSGRVIAPSSAAAILLLSAAGPLLVGTQVARTVGGSIVDLAAQGALGFVLITAISVAVVLGSLQARVPTSMTLALVGSMVGWALADSQTSTIHWSGVARVVIAMPLSVLAAATLSFAFYRGVRRALTSVAHRKAMRLARSQYLTSALQAIAYGSNDMEKTIGLVVVAGTIGGAPGATELRGWVPPLVAFLTFAGGAMVGGWSIARRVGVDLVRMRPVQAMSEQLGAGLVVAGLALAGAPVSSTQTIGGSLVGVGVSVRASAVRWHVVRAILTSWIVTLPLALAAALVTHALLRASVGIQ
jgi:PiT family inorganic phosphate transporter